MLTILVIVTVVTLGMSFFCSLSEAAFYSISAGKIEQLRQEGSKAGERLAKMRENVDEPIAAILTLNTVANSGGAAFAGALVGMAFPEKAGLATAIYSGAFVVLVLYFGEIVPKTIGVTFADRIAPALSLPIKWMIRISWPVIAVGQTVTKALRRGAAKVAPQGPSEREILAMAEMGARAGTILADEARWAINAMRLNDVTARDLMTPRTVVYLLPADLPLSMITTKSEHWTHSRLPVVRNNDPDRVEGVIYRRDVFDQLAQLEEKDLASRRLRDLMHPAVFVPETIRCNELLRRFLDSKQKLIVVTNEFGGMEGVISLEDVLEFILGEEIVDIHDKHADMQEYAREMAKLKMRRRGELSLTPLPRAGGGPPKE